MKKFCGHCVVFFLAIHSAAPAQSFSQTSKSTTARYGNAAGITAAQLKDYLPIVASDEMAGRDTPSPGMRTTALFLANAPERPAVDRKLPEALAE